MISKKVLSFEYVDELFSYKDGDLVWKVRPRSHFSSDGRCRYWNRRFSGKIAGGPNVQTREIRYVITINDVRYYKSILIWCLCNGEWPSVTVDHVDRDTTNDRIENLRLATSRQQTANRGMTTRNQSGFKGVINRKSEKHKWRYAIMRDGKRKYVGGFGTAEEAHVAYAKELSEAFGDFAYTG